MLQIPGGWRTLRNSNPLKISDKIVYAKLGSTDGEVEDSADYNSPTGGSWNASPLSISAYPTFAAVNPTYSQQDALIANSLNEQTQTGFSSAPPDLNNLVYMYANPGDVRFFSALDFDFGGSTYNTVEISVFENCVTRGDAHGNIEVFRFTGSFTGTNTLQMILGDFAGPVNFGIRLESSTNQSSIYELKTVVLKPI